MCSGGCSSSACPGCSTVRGQRGPRGLQGPAGADGTVAQVLYGDGAPSTAPDPVTAYALYEDTATDGHWWIWTPGTPGAWTDTGARVSGADGADGRNAYTVTTAATAIPAAGGFMLITVAAGENAWAVPGQVVYIQTAGYFRVLNLVGTTQVALLNLRNNTTGAYASNAVSGPLVVGSEISPGGIQGPVGPTVEITFGSAAPTVAPAGGASGFYIRTGGNYYVYPAPSGPWTDTGASVTGPAGATGATGAAGHSPVVTTVSSNPTGAGGAAGDIRLYQPPNNNGFTTFYYNLAGAWTQGPTVLANRLIGSSTTNPTPNPSNVPANVNDYYWTAITSGSVTTVTMSVCSVAGSPGTWVTAFSFTNAGVGGGVGIFQQVSDASPVLGPGRNLGTNVVTTPNSIQYFGKVVPITSLLTTTLDTTAAFQRISIQVASFTIDYTTPTAGFNRIWIFEFTNDSGGTSTITWSTSRWSKSAGITQPTVLADGEVVAVHCNYFDGHMNITAVEQSVTIIT